MKKLASKKTNAGGRRKSGRENIRSLTKTGGGRSYTVSLPAAIIREFHWQERQRLELSFDRKRRRITISDWPRSRNSARG